MSITILWIAFVTERVVLLSLCILSFKMHRKLRSNWSLLVFVGLFVIVGGGIVEYVYLLVVPAGEQPFVVNAKVTVGMLMLIVKLPYVIGLLIASIGFGGVVFKQNKESWIGSCQKNC